MGICTLYISSVFCRRQKTAQSPEQAAAAAATGRLEQCARTQSPYLIIITGDYNTLVTTTI